MYLSARADCVPDVGKMTAYCECPMMGKAITNKFYYNQHVPVFGLFNFFTGTLRHLQKKTKKIAKPKCLKTLMRYQGDTFERM